MDYGSRPHPQPRPQSARSRTAAPALTQDDGTAGRPPLVGDAHRCRNRLDRELGGRQTSAMRLAGWNDIPRGYGARFDTASAPAWLQILSATPFLDRFAYPLLVHRGLGFLTPHPGWPATKFAPVTGGWRLEVPEHWSAGSVAWLHPNEYE